MNSSDIFFKPSGIFGVKTVCCIRFSAKLPASKFSFGKELRVLMKGATVLKESGQIYQDTANVSPTRSLSILTFCSCVFFYLLWMASQADAAIVVTGDVDPTDPATWTSSTFGYVGKTGNGEINITGGSELLNSYGYVGYESSASGQITVDGAGSEWNTNALRISNSGSGTLNITDSGAVNAVADTFVAANPSSSGMIYFDNGTLTTRGLFCAADDLGGTGTINANGLVSDVDLVFDATHGLSQTFKINKNPGQDITVNLDVDGSDSMGVGYRSDGTMRISDGTVVESKNGYIGYHSGSTGQVTVNGAGSKWDSHDMHAGHFGNGTLKIEGGGEVDSSHGRIGLNPGSTGHVTVDGTGSKWSNGSFYVGESGKGTISVTNNGEVISGQSYIGYNSSSTGEATVDGAGSIFARAH